MKLDPRLIIIGGSWKTHRLNLTRNQAIASPFRLKHKKTIIGKQLGFDIEMDNPILAEVLGDVGANTVLQ